MERERIEEAMHEYQEAKMRLEDAKSRLTQVAYESLNMTVGEAFKLGLVKFNFPTPVGFKRAIVEK